MISQLHPYLLHIFEICRFKQFDDRTLFDKNYLSFYCIDNPFDYKIHIYNYYADDTKLIYSIFLNENENFHFKSDISRHPTNIKADETFPNNFGEYNLDPSISIMDFLLSMYLADTRNNLIDSIIN